MIICCGKHDDFGGWKWFSRLLVWANVSGEIHYDRFVRELHDLCMFMCFHWNMNNISYLYFYRASEASPISVFLQGLPPPRVRAAKCPPKGRTHPSVICKKKISVQVQYVSNSCICVFVYLCDFVYDTVRKYLHIMHFCYYI